DTLRLTITATDGENTKEADLRPLLANFDILQRANSSNYSLVNGRGSRTEQLQLDITPKREGVLSIPAMRVGKGVTNALEVAVSSAPNVSAGGQPVLFEAEVDSDSVYVQGQVILTLRLQQSINLDNRSISELELDNAFVSKLEQKTFQRTIDDRQWLVNEVRYALFPEQSGTLEIPGQVFTARLPGTRRSLFDVGGSGRLIRRNSEPLSIEVLPIPDAFAGDAWLPARQVTIEEQWSTSPDELRVGESVTRTLRIQGEGVQGAQLPPVLFTPVEGLKFYPDQPQISEQEMSTGLIGLRIDSAAIVPTREGEWTLPEIRIPWWDTQAQQVRYVTVPERTLSVAPAAPTTLDSPGVATTGTEPAAERDGATLALETGSALPWQLLALFSTVGWLATLAWLVLRQRRPRTTEPAQDRGQSGRAALKQLRRACGASDALATRQAVISWANALYRDTAHPRASDTGFSSLQQVASWFADEELSTQLQALESSLFGAGGGQWDGAALDACTQRLHGHAPGSATGPENLVQLYPKSA
ncbi:MAG: BatD family protein, partial [Halioglobus sp.]